MRLSQVKTYHSGDEIWWEDPDGGACSRYYKIKSIEIEGNVVSIEDEDGSHLEAFAREMRVRAPATRRVAEAEKLLEEWLRTPFFEKKEDWEKWVAKFRPRVEKFLEGP